MGMRFKYLLSFLGPGAAFSSLVSVSVHSHLAKAAYSSHDISQGTLEFCVAAFLGAGLFGIAFAKASGFERYKSLCLGGLAFFLVLGFVFGFVTLTDFYDHPSGTARDWFVSTTTAFGLFGTLPASLLFGLALLQNRSKSGLDEDAESHSSAS